MKKQFLYIFSFLLVGCSVSEKQNTYDFSHNDFSYSKALKGEKIELEEMINPDNIFVVYDSLIIASNEDPAQRDKVQLFSLLTGKRISSFGAKGHASNELVSCSLFIQSSSSDYFFVDDIAQSKYWVCSVDSFKNGRNPICKSFNYSRDVISLLPEDTTYIGFNFWYLNSKEYNNGIDHAIDRYLMESKNERNRSTKYGFFVANVSGAVIVKNPNNGDVWVAYNHENLIEIYDKSLELNLRMIGPEKAHSKYVVERIKNKDYLSYGRSHFMDCFYAAVATDSHVYLLYRNINNVAFPTKPEPVEIFKIDWNGQLVCNYQLDQYAYCISVDSKEENLYAACVNSDTGDTELVKYQL